MSGFYMILLFISAVHAEGLKRGTSLCTLGDCSLKDVPLGASFSQPHLTQEKKALHQESEKHSKPHRAKQVHSVASTPVHENKESGNLPDFYQGSDRSGYQMSQIADTQVTQVDLKLPGLKAGDIIAAVVEQSIKASPSVATPVRAMLVSGPYKGSFVLGQATLDKELKRVLFHFVKLRRPDTDQVYSMKAQGLSPSGQVGLEGEYENQSGKFFVGEFLAGAAAGFADATTQRSQTSFGTYVTDPSLGNAGKQGAVSALSKTAEHFAEQTRSAPEFTQVAGFQSIQVIFEEDPIELGS